MKLIIDAREAYRPKKAGKGQWTAGFLRELKSRHPNLIILADSDCTESGVVTFPKGITWHIRAAAYVRKSGADFYISPTSFIVPFLLCGSVRFILVIHDLIAFHDEPHDKKAKWIERLLLKRVVSRAAHICVNSISTKQDLLLRFPRLSPSYVSTIYAGPMCATVKRTIPDGKTILCVGTLCPRKNQERLIRAYTLLPERLRQAYCLVLVGARGWDDAEILRLSRIIDGVCWKQYVSDENYGALLSHASVFAYPSLYEGFGMQVLDAMQRGIPVLTSDRGSLKEIAGAAALTVDPENERSIASGLIAILEHDDVRQKLAEAGPARAGQFSWKRTVDLFMDALDYAYGV